MTQGFRLKTDGVHDSIALILHSGAWVCLNGNLPQGLSSGSCWL